MTKISILLPVYNAQETISRAINSALDQHGIEIEVIVVNDGSTDDTAHYLKGWPEGVRVITRENGGLVAALNTALAAATGEYCIRLDADDWFVPNCLARLAMPLLRGGIFSYGCVRYHGQSCDYRYTAGCGADCRWQ